MCAQTVAGQAGGCQPTLQVPHLDGVVHASRQQLVAITGVEILQATQIFACITATAISETGMATMQAEHGKTMKRKNYTFRRQFNDKPSIVPGCPGW